VLLAYKKKKNKEVFMNDVTVVVKKPGFFIYLIAFFIPPLYFLLRMRIFSFIISLALLIIAVPFFFVFGFGAFIWLGVAIWALFGVKNESTNAILQQQATMIAKAIKAENAPVS
jgi:hypothetical protein